VLQTDGLVGISVEGLSPSHQEIASQTTIEIADLTFYYGEDATFERAQSIVFAQLKYSLASLSRPFRAADAKETIRKFAHTYYDQAQKYGAAPAAKKVEFELITNRPIYAEFAKALAGIRSGSELTKRAKRQAAQFSSACGFKGHDLVMFARKFRLTGLVGQLNEQKKHLARALADWSPTSDLLARARLGELRDLVRNKAGHAGTGRNLIKRADVLFALGLHGPDDLAPCPSRFPKVEKIVARRQLGGVLAVLAGLKRPLLIHSAGGVGKTVFLQNLADILRETHQVVQFDCFAGGAYRSPEDARHLPRRGLVHIANELACSGLCDPILPGEGSVEDLIKTFRARLGQAVATLRGGSSRTRPILLLLDAIDNAADEAKIKREAAFPTLLLESLHYTGPIDGVQLIVSCRTHRRLLVRKDMPCEEFELQPFDLTETTTYLREHVQGITDAQIHVAFSRSGGNPRILQYLVLDKHGLDDPQKHGRLIKLDDLIVERIQRALDAAMRTEKQTEIDAFLAGLAVLPPPVPLGDYASAHEIELSAVQTFAANLAPLLEHTRHGLIFRDEPTETFVKENYAAKPQALRLLAENLFKMQGTSVYAATALPGLLEKINDGERLFSLAFDDRFPDKVATAAAKQSIRYMRLKAAVRHASASGDSNRLVHLLVELSTLAAVNARGTDYILQNPLLVVASHDAHATRRLFESRTAWPGAKHARLSVARVLAGDLSDAYRHALIADDWINHYFEQSRESRIGKAGPEKLDIVSIPLCLAAASRAGPAGRYLDRWNPPFAFKVCEELLQLLQYAVLAGSIPSTSIRSLIKVLQQSPVGAAACLSFLALPAVTRRRLARQLARNCNKLKITRATTEPHRAEGHSLEDALLKAVSIAASMGLNKIAAKIAKKLVHQRPRLWALSGPFAADDIFPFLAQTALRAAVRSGRVAEVDLLPEELIKCGGLVKRGSTGHRFRTALKAAVDSAVKSRKAGEPNAGLDYDTKSMADRFIDELIEPLLGLTQKFSKLLCCRSGRAEGAFHKLVEACTLLTRKGQPSGMLPEKSVFLTRTGMRFLALSLRIRTDLRPAAVAQSLDCLMDGGAMAASELVEILADLSKREALHELVGEVAMRTKALIEREDDVAVRSSLYAQLASAVLPASREEAAGYFRAGLDQMDAIGSGDFGLVNELLQFGSRLQGQELGDEEVHTLLNICELNIYDSDRFPWWLLGKALSRLSGCRGFARLGRWHDRQKVSLDYTLLPYLTALVEDGKVELGAALALLRLSQPVESWDAGSVQLAAALETKGGTRARTLLAELIFQFESNNPGVPLSHTRFKLSEISRRVLGKSASETVCLTKAACHFDKVRQEQNDLENASRGVRLRPDRKKGRGERDKRALKKAARMAFPMDPFSISRALDIVNKLKSSFDLRAGFFNSLRRKVKYAQRASYMRTIAGLPVLLISEKLKELRQCKDIWLASTGTLAEAVRSLSTQLLQIHAQDLISHGHLSDWILKDVADICGVPLHTLAAQVIRMFAAPESHLPASAWMGFASIICGEAAEGQGQSALVRLLKSSGAKLSSAAEDGPWKEGLYPTNDQTEIVAGLVWLTLGSPRAADRWRAAHAIRCLARFGAWRAVDSLVTKLPTTNSFPYQAQELGFYFFNARLWLLIALARTAVDHPSSVAAYTPALRKIALDPNEPHVLIRHFASEALLACAQSQHSGLSSEDVKFAREVNVSKFAPVSARPRRGNPYYEPRPTSFPEPESEFHLDHDFGKNEVFALAQIFDRSIWEARDAITAWVRNYDISIKGMYDRGGREESSRLRPWYMNSWYHSYGQQLGWHALYSIAGQFLAKYPTVKGEYDPAPWGSWLNGELLTRRDGVWLADGTDRPPLDTLINLLDLEGRQAVLNGQKETILRLVGMAGGKGDIVVHGAWHSADQVEVRVSSALVSKAGTAKALRGLLKEKPFRAWLPTLEEDDYGREFHRNTKPGCVPWVVYPSVAVKLDGCDPLGATTAACRPRLARTFAAVASLKVADRFGRSWVNRRGQAVALSEAWGRSEPENDNQTQNGSRLTCRPAMIKAILASQGLDLLLLVILRRRERGYSSHDDKYWETSAVIHIRQSLAFTLHEGSSNELAKRY
jgi:hypothetical protein